MKIKPAVALIVLVSFSVLFNVKRACAQADFDISATTLVPATVPSGSSATSTVTIASKNGFSSPVTLVPACPTGTTCTFNPPAPTPTADSTITSILTVSTSGSTPVSSSVGITGTSGALTHTTSVQLNLTSTAPNTQSLEETLKNNFGFGVALGLSTNVTGANIVNNASIDANGIVRVDTRANTAAGFMLESHYYIWPNPPTIAQLEANSDIDTRWYGTGPFVAVQPGSTQIIQAVGAGWMIGFRRPKGSTPSGFGLGVGYEAIPAAQVLGGEFVPNKPAPVTPAGTPIPIRYETQDKGALLVVLSITF